ncbi:DUF3795 domain-containing protein [candidate division WOR-3 bacterium]|nr:DUF3795 domain-containing protein [candidate division WOR-3 bacterium]
MEKHPIKTHPTLGCCGLDCGLCPRYYTVGNSRCPGCCGPDFWQKHPSCSFITCCVKKRNLEVCAECSEFPCSKFKDAGKYDSFLTYKRVIQNLDFIKEHGVEEFIEQQKKRIELLLIMLKHFDDGRSKSFYCIATTLLSIKDLKGALDNAEQKIKEDKSESDDTKTRAKLLKGFLNDIAAREGIELTLRKK